MSSADVGISAGRGFGRGIAPASCATRLGELGANILEVDHKRLFLDVPAKGTRLDVTVETRDRMHADEIINAMEAEGYEPVRIEAGDAME